MRFLRDDDWRLPKRILRWAKKRLTTYLPIADAD
jgi:hypothetical protein